MKQKWIPLATTLLGCALASGTVSAASWSDRVSLSGFSSLNYNRTDSSIPFNGEENIGHDNQGSWSDTRIGFIINAKINDRLRFASQLHGVQKEGYGLDIDWGFADVSVSENLNFRAGKIKFPVGLVNEYVDVGYAMPWIIAPVAVYSEMGAPNGPQLTREAYTGGSVLGSASVGDVNINADAFTGEIVLETGKVRNLFGFTVTADWDDTVLFKASAYEGTMRGFADMAAPMNGMEGKRHLATMVGMKADWNNVIFYGEHATTKMGDLANMQSTSWYTTLGYQFDSILPHLTYQSFEQGQGSAATQSDKQNIITAGLRWGWMPGVALKFEFSQIRTSEGVGLFPSTATNVAGTTVNMVGFGVDTVF